jgi:hypothetical protein
MDREAVEREALERGERGSGTARESVDMKGGGVRAEGGVGECENSVLPRGDEDTM